MTTSDSEKKPSDEEKVIRINPIEYLKEVKSEMAKVTWPSRKEATRLTIIVVIVALLVGAFIGSLDFIFTKITEYLIQ